MKQFYQSLLLLTLITVTSYGQTAYTITYQGLTGNTSAQNVPTGITVVTPYNGVVASCNTSGNGATTSYTLVLAAATGYNFTITSIGGAAYSSTAGSRDFSLQLINGSNTYTSAVTSLPSSSSCGGTTSLTPLSVPSAGQLITSGNQVTIKVLRAPGAGSGGGYSWTRTLTVTGTVTPVSSSTDAFRSQTNGNWNDVATWESFSGGNWIDATLTPTSAASTITIKNTHTVTVTADITIDQTVIESGATLKVNPGKTLTLNNGTGADITVNTGGILNFVSDATGCGRLGVVPSGATISGDVTVERYIPSLARKYRYVAAPVTASLEDGWHQQVHITGPGTGGTACPDVNSNGFDYTATNNPSMFTYDETQAAGSKWVNVPNTAITLTPGTGYRLNIRGPKSDGCGLLDGSNNTQNPVTLKATGAITTGNVSVTLTGGNGGYGYTLVGNPYPSEINWANATWTTLRNNNNIENSYVSYFPCNTATTANANFYSVCLSGSGIITNNCNSLTNPDIIASGQAFFVKYNSGTGTTLPLSNFFQESYKSSTVQTGMFKTTTTADMIRIAFKNTDSNRIDECFVRFANNGNELYDLQQDATALSSSSFNIAALKDQNRLAIQTRPIVNTDDTVRLDINGTNGNYLLHFSDNDQLQTTPYLIDHYSGTVQNVKATSYYPFSINTDVSSKGNSRFELVFINTNTSSVGTVNRKLSTSIYPNPVQEELNIIIHNVPTKGNYAISITNMQGQKVLNYSDVTANNGIIKINTTGLISGIYFVQITDASGNTSIEKIIK